MQSLTDFPIYIPRKLAGKWRLTMQGFFQVEGQKKEKTECMRVYFDFVEE